MKVNAIEAILDKADADIARFVQEQTVKSRVLQSAANKVIAKKVVEGIRIATDLSLAITRLVISAGADIMAW